MEYITKNEKETLKLGKNFALTLKGGETICLVGDLGAGKTIFTKGVAKGLGIKKIVNSPTFVIMKVYQTSHKTIKNLCHIDAYRLSGYDDLVHIGAKDYINAKDAVTIIEWGDKVKNIFPKNCLVIKILNKENNRTIKIKR